MRRFASEVALQVSRRTLETLEWPLLVERLRAHARTPGGRRRCEPEASSELFADDPDTARAHLAETSEARALLEAWLAGAPQGAAADRRSRSVNDEEGAAPVSYFLGMQVKVGRSRLRIDSAELGVQRVNEGTADVGGQLGARYGDRF